MFSLVDIGFLHCLFKYTSRGWEVFLIGQMVFYLGELGANRNVSGNIGMKLAIILPSYMRRSRRGPWVSSLSEQQWNLPTLSSIPLCATVKSTIPEFHTSVCISQIYHPRVSNLSVQQSNLPSLSFIPLCAKVKSTISEFHTSMSTVKSTIPEFHTSLFNSQIYHSFPSFILTCTTVKSTISKFHTSLCNSQIYHPRVSCLSVQQSNIPSPSFKPLCATVESTIPEFHTSLCNSRI